MIKANELRIGNGILYGGIETTITEKLLTEIVNDDIIKTSVNGIPLTPEILEKCGFVEWTKDNWIKREYPNNVGWSDTFNFYLPYFKFSNYIGNIEIKYLHQLQNLYFALTGEELSVHL